MKREGESFLSLSLISTIYFIVGVIVIAIGLLCVVGGFTGNGGFILILSGFGAALAGLFITGASEIIKLFMNLEQNSFMINAKMDTIIESMRNKEKEAE